jgi:hypothetical protein
MITASAHLLPLYDEFLDYLVDKATASEILAYTPSQDVLDHARELVERSQESGLTPEERQQLEQMLQLERMISILKAKALLAASG